MASSRKPPRPIRSDGWTLPRQRLFIKMLALTGSVEKSADHAQMSASSAYRLRLHPDGGAFRRAWEAALEGCATSLREIAFDRAINGVNRSVIENGVLVGREAVFNDQLLMFMLRRYDTRSSRSPHQVIIDSFDRLVEADDPDSEIVALEPDKFDDANANPGVDFV